jgi:ABC-type bacteriocin/lantibiotic exporter with double-glycine peptidase domain
MCYEWLFSQQILEALITMLYTTLYAIVVGICIYYCRYVYTQYLYYNIYIYISKQLMTTYLHYSLDWFEAPKSGSYGPYFPLTASIHGSVFLSSCVYTHIIYIYTHLSPLWYSIWIFHLAIGPLHPNISVIIPSPIHIEHSHSMVPGMSFRPQHPPCFLGCVQYKGESYPLVI